MYSLSPPNEHNKIRISKVMSMSNKIPTQNICIPKKINNNSNDAIAPILQTLNRRPNLTVSKIRILCPSQTTNKKLMTTSDCTQTNKIPTNTIKPVPLNKLLSSPVPEQYTIKPVPLNQLIPTASSPKCISTEIPSQLTVHFVQNDEMNKLPIDGGRIIKIDHCIDGIQQSFHIKLLDQLNYDDVEDQTPTFTILNNQNHPSHLKNNKSKKNALNKKNALRKRLKSIVKKPFNYVKHLMTKLSNNKTNYKNKKKSFKNLILTYRTKQKNDLKMK